MIWLTAVQAGLVLLPQLLKAINAITQAVEKDAPPQSGQVKAQMVSELVETVLTSADDVSAASDPETKEMIRGMVRPCTEAVVKFHNTVGNFTKSSTFG